MLESSSEKRPGALVNGDVRQGRATAYLRSDSELEEEYEEYAEDDELGCEEKSRDVQVISAEGDIPDSARAVSSLLQTPVFKQKNKIEIE